MLLRGSKYFHDARKLLSLVLTRKDRVAGQQFSKDAAKRPHVYWHTIGHPKNDFRRAVEARLDVGVYFLVFQTRRAEINNFDLRVCWMGKEDIFRLEVTMYDFLTFEKDQAAQELLCKTAYQFGRKPAEFVTFDEFVEVHAQEFG